MDLVQSQTQSYSDESLCRLAASGDPLAETELVGRYTRLVRVCARPLFLAGGDSEDLIQEGMLGLLAAIRGFQSGKETSFRTYAEICVRSRLYAAVRAAQRDKHFPLNHSVSFETPLFDGTSAHLFSSEESPEDVMESFADYREVNIFLRGMVPLVGFPSEVVTYERHERLAGDSHYPLSKMLALAFDGITSLSNKPIRIITGAGIVVSLIGFIGVIWAIVQAILGSSVAGWASIVCIVCFMGGVQLVCLGVIGEYIGKIYMETKARPRYIISERTWAPYERKYHG